MNRLFILLLLCILNGCHYPEPESSFNNSELEPEKKTDKSDKSEWDSWQAPTNVKLPDDFESRTIYALDDPLYWNEALGRNAWAFKCGYIKHKMYEALKEDFMFIIFKKGKYLGNPNIPIHPKEPCIKGLEFAGYVYPAPNHIKIR